MTIELRRYDAVHDELVPVDQAWVDLAQRAMNRMHQERFALELELVVAKDEILRLKATSGEPIL